MNYKKHFNLSHITKSHLQNFKEVLHKNKYTAKSFNSLLINPFCRSVIDYAVVSHKLRDLKPFNILYYLFFLGSEIELKNIEKTFTTKQIATLLQIHILEESSKGKVRSCVLLFPFQSYYFASDFFLRYQHNQNIPTLSQNYDMVYPIGKDSLDLWNGFIKQKTDSLLDLCTGCGFHAILATQYVKKVYGIDINARAINFAQFNALLNNVYTLEFKRGNLYGRFPILKFDRILANPPFQISPMKSLRYRDGGILGYDITQKIISGIPRHLKTGGIAQIMMKFYETRKINKKKLLFKWLKNYPFLIHYTELKNLDRFHEAWMTYNDGIVIDYQKYIKRFITLLDYFDKIELTDISYGMGIFTWHNKFHYMKKKFYRNKLNG